MKQEFKYVWLNLTTGEFSNSWDQETQNSVADLMKGILEYERAGWKLIKYRCVNQPEFEFYNKMKIK